MFKRPLTLRDRIGTYRGGYYDSRGSYRPGPPGPGCVNALVDSWQFTGADWTDLTVGNRWVYTTGQSDPFGGNKATLFTGGADVIGGIYTRATPVPVTSEDAVLQVWIKNGNLDGTKDTAIRLFDTADNAFAQLTIDWAGPTASPGGSLDVSGDIGPDLGDGYHLAWIVADLTGRIGHDIEARLSPAVGGTVVTGDTMYCAAMQLEFGVTEPCGTYVEKP